MTLVPFLPPPGLNSDDTTFAAEGRWADGNNVRFVGGKPQVIDGWVEDFAGGLTGTPTNLLPGAVNDAFLIIATTTKLYAVSPADVATDITPAGFTSTTEWSLARWGSYVLAAPLNGALYVWDGNIANDATVVATAPANISSMIVTAERQVLAFGCNEEIGAAFNTKCIRGSDIEDYTDWTTSPSNNAFEHILTETGPIVAGRRVGAYVGVWTETGLFLGTFIGDPSQTYRFDPVGAAAGLAGPGLLVVNGSTAWWMTLDGFLRTYTLGGMIDPIPCPIFEDFINHVDSQQAFGVYMPKYEEIWFFYDDSRDAGSIPTRYFAFSIREGTWFRGIMTRTAMNSEYAVIGTDVSGAVFRHDTGNTAAGSALNWHIQSADQYIDNSGRRMMIRAILSDFEEQVGDVSLTLYVRDRPQSTPVTKGPHTLTTSTTKKDFRASGKAVAVRFSGGAASGSYMRLGKPVFDVVPMGER